MAGQSRSQVESPFAFTLEFRAHSRRQYGLSESTEIWSWRLSDGGGSDVCSIGYSRGGERLGNVIMVAMILVNSGGYIVVINVYGARGGKGRGGGGSSRRRNFLGW